MAEKDETFFGVGPLENIALEGARVIRDGADCRRFRYDCTQSRTLKGAQGTHEVPGDPAAEESSHEYETYRGICGLQWRGIVPAPDKFLCCVGARKWLQIRSLWIQSPVGQKS